MDLEQWHRLCGEYLIEFIRELSEAVHSKNKSLIVGIGQGNYIGLPNGNMYVDWQGWVKSQLVDGLVMGDITGQFLLPDRVGYGYLTEQESGIGVPNILWALQSDYWPLCATYGVKLYVKVYAPGFKDIPVPAFMKSNVDGVVLSMTQIVGDQIVTEEPGTILTARDQAIRTEETYRRQTSPNPFSGVRPRFKSGLPGEVPSNL